VDLLEQGIQVAVTLSFGIEFFAVRAKAAQLLAKGDMNI